MPPSNENLDVRLTNIENTVGNLDVHIRGNGKPGLTEMVRNLQADMQTVLGFMKHRKEQDDKQDDRRFELIKIGLSAAFGAACMVGFTWLIGVS